MALQNFKITYRDGSTQIVRAAGYRPVSGMIIFYDHKSPVHSCHGSEVESISRVDVPDRERPGPFVA